MTITAIRVPKVDAVDGNRRSVKPNPDREPASDRLDYQRADYPARRLRVTLLYISVDKGLPTVWINPTSEGLRFTELTLRQADDLVRSLDDIAANHQVKPRRPGTGELSLFGIDPQ